jgi:hypothetical protein
VHHGNRKILIFRNGREYKAGSTRPTPFAYPKREYSAWSSRFCRTAQVFPDSSSPVSHTPIKLPPAAPRVILLFSPSSFPPTPGAILHIFLPPLLLSSCAQPPPSLHRRAAPSLRCASSSLRRAPACRVLAPPAQIRAQAARARPWPMEVRRGSLPPWPDAISPPVALHAPLRPSSLLLPCPLHGAPHPPLPPSKLHGRRRILSGEELHGLRRHLMPTDRAATSFRLALPRRGTTERGRGAGAGAGSRR